MLTSRTGTLPASVTCEFTAAGCRVVVLKADAADQEDMARVLTHVRENLPHIQHYAHAAGVSGFDMLQDIQADAFWNVANAKVVGASMAAQSGLALESQVLFSSTSAVWSQTGAAHYAAANAFLDGLASEQQAAGLPATSLQLGPFAEAGMAAGHVAELETIGLKSLHPTQLQEAVLATGSAPSMVYARIDAQKFVKLYTAKGRWSLLDAALKTPPSTLATLHHQTGAIASLQAPTSVETNGGKQHDNPRGAPNGLTLESVAEVIKKVARDVLGDANGDFDEFPAGGFDSLSAVELSSTVGTSLGVSLPATLVYDYPSVSTMAAHVHSLVTPTQAGGVLVNQAPGPLALVGPTATALSNDIQMFEVTFAAKIAQPNSSGLSTGLSADAISTVPYGRWNLEALRVS